MKQSALNKHPIVAPILAEWRKARDAKEAADLDGRVGHDRVKSLSRKADTWRDLYDHACRVVLA